MSLLDTLTNAAASAIGGNAQNQAAQLVAQLVQQNGSIANLVAKFQQGELGEALQGIDAAQIQNVLGGQLQEAAAKVGLDVNSAGSLLAQYLPQIAGAFSSGGASDSGTGLDGIAKMVMQHLGK